MITLEFKKEDIGLDKLNMYGLEAENYEIMQIKKFIGNAETVALIVTLSTTTITAISKIIIEKIKANKTIKVKYKGVEITGLSGDNTLKILKELCKKDDH
jgi:hypothetical protein